MTASLFPELEPIVPPPAERVSPDRRRTLRQRADIERGVHPLAKTRTDPDAEHTCGSCVHRVLIGHHDRTWPKCDLTEMSRSAASDVRAWWPGCTKWQPRTEEHTL